MKHKYTTNQLAQMDANPWLTDRERKVFDLHYKRGWAQEDIAAELEICRKTVYNSLNSIRAKCGL